MDPVRCSAPLQPGLCVLISCAVGQMRHCFEDRIATELCTSRQQPRRDKQKIRFYSISPGEVVFWVPSQADGGLIPSDKSPSVLLFAAHGPCSALLPAVAAPWHYLFRPRASLLLTQQGRTNFLYRSAVVKYGVEMVEQLKRSQGKVGRGRRYGD